jgi:hypothetical protein
MVAARAGSAGPFQIALAVWAALLLGCTRNIRLLPATSASDAGDGSSPAGEGGAAQCTGLGNPITLPTAAGPVCASALATRGHRFAFCACATADVTSRLRTDAFDSTNSSVQDTTSAAVGINGGLQTTAELRAGGAIYVAGSAGVQAADHLQSGASLQIGGPLSMLASNTDVALDGYVAGDVTGDVRITGTLHVPATATVDPKVQAAAIVVEPVSVGAPCDCSDGFAEVATAISAAAIGNGDDAAGIAVDRLAALTAAATLDLPCGTFYLSAVDAPAALTLAVHGHALLAVGGDVDLGGGLTVALDDGAELDLLVGGRLASSGGFTIGNVAAPARFRIWLGGTDSADLDGAPTIGAVIHAPAVAVNASQGLVLYGSLLADSFNFDDDSELHFDRAILSGGVPCGEPAALPIP